MVRMQLLAVLMAGIILVAGCDRPAAEPVVPEIAEPAPSTSVMLLGYDGATWFMLRPLLRMGQVPALERLLAGGSSGTIQSMIPMVSPRIWNSVITGKTPEKHGITEFIERRRLPDGTQKSRLFTSRDRRVRAIWNILSEHGRSAAAVGWWNSWPAERVRGPLVSMLAWPFMKYRYAKPFEKELDQLAGLSYPENWQADAILDCRQPDQIPLEERDAWGLADDPWYYAKDMSVVAQAERLRSRFRPDFLALFVQGIDATSHPFWYESNRVARYYRLADGVWDRLAAGVDRGTTVVLLSDHGFQGVKDLAPKEPRPGGGGGGGPMPLLLTSTPGVHQELGVFAVAGPAFRRGHRLRGAGELDLTPTLLPLYDLPVAQDMDGKVLTQAFRPEFFERNPIRTIPTYETAPREEAQGGDAGAMEEAVKERLESIGYVL